MSNDEKNVSNIITTHVVFSMTAGAIPIPIIDVISVTAIQVDMIRQIADVFKVEFNKEVGKSVVTSLIGTSLARFGASAIKSIPGVGTFLGIGSQVILSGAATYSLGKLFEAHFSQNGTLFNINIDSLKAKYEEYYAEGKKFASELKEKSKTEDVFATIDKLNKLKESGAITEQEFEDAKKKLLEKI